MLSFTSSECVKRVSIVGLLNRQILTKIKLNRILKEQSNMNSVWRIKKVNKFHDCF